MLIAVPVWAGSLNLIWKDNANNETGFRVQRKCVPEANFSPLVTLPTQNLQQYIDTTAPVNVLCAFRVLAYNTAGDSAWSNEASGTATAATPPVPPEFLTCKITEAEPPTGDPSLVLALGFNEPSGTTTADASQYGNTGTLNGPTRTTAGKYGGALTFDGVNDWVTVANASTLNLTTGMTLEAWVYPTVTLTGWQSLLTKEMSGNSAYIIYANIVPSNQTNMGIMIGSTEYILVGGPRPAANVWTHIAVTYDGAMMRFYINGTQTATQARTGSIVSSTGPLRIGGNSMWGEYFTGRIDDVRVYNRALSGSEIQGTMATPIP